jgi:hypothetical protein
MCTVATVGGVATYKVITNMALQQTRGWRFIFLRMDVYCNEYGTLNNTLV